jgi:hypothetical protein
VRVEQFVSAIVAMEVPVFACYAITATMCLRQETVKFVRLALKVFMQNEKYFVAAILLYFTYILVLSFVMSTTHIYYNCKQKFYSFVPYVTYLIFHIK